MLSPFDMYSHNISKDVHSNIETKERKRRLFGDRKSFWLHNAGFKPGTKYG